MKGSRRGMRAMVALVVMVALVALVAAPSLGGAQGTKERFKWIVSDKFTLLEGGATFNSAATFADTVTFSSSDLDLDGNSLIIDTDGDSILVEASDDLVTFTAGAATGSLEVRTGNLQVGDGSPGETHNGEDFYVEGISELDGAAYFDGAVDMDSTLDTADTATFSKGSGNAVVVSAGGSLSLPATADVAAYGFVAVGDGTPDGSVAAGTDEELYVEGDFEVDGEAEFDGAIDADGTLNLAGAATLGADVTLSPDTNGGNQGAKNEYTGLPRIKLVGLGQGTNPGAETVACMDATPTGEWTEVDAGTNLVVTADTGYYRDTTNSIKIAFTDVVENDGVSGAIPAQDDLSGLESVAFWIYSDVAISSADFDLTVDDSDGADQVYTIGAVTADIWTWVEVDISGCNANCDTTDNLIILATAQGAAALGAANIYIDAVYYWDSVDEDALGTAILRDGVLSIVDAESGASLAEYTDYIVHEESGNDFVVWITDQSGADAVALVAY